MWNVRGSLVITSISACLISSCSLAPNGPSNRIRISLPGGSSQVKNVRGSSSLFASLRGLQRIQEMLGISTLEAGNILPYSLPTAVPTTVPSSPTGFQCFGVNVTGPGISPPAGLPKDSCVPGNMPGSGIYGGLIYSSTGGEIEVDVPSGRDRTIQVFGIQTDGYCPSVSEIASQPLGMHPFQYAYELGRSKVDVADDTSVTVKISSNTSSAPRMFCDPLATSTITRQWTRQMGAAGATLNGQSITVDSSSNVFVAGYTDVGLDGNTQTGIIDFFVTKYDSTGQKLWTRQLGIISKHVYANGISADSSGNVYVAGYTDGGLDGNSLTGSQDFFVTKYSSAGVKMWTRQLGVASFLTMAYAISVDSSGNAYVAGSTTGGLDGNTLSGTGAVDLFVTKYDSSGAKIWTQQLGVATKTTETTSITLDSFGNFYVAGYTNGSLDGNTLTGTNDFFIVKYASTGTKLWSKQLGVASQATYANSISADSSGNVYIAGQTNGSLDGNALTGTQDLLVAKYDSSGTRLWTRQLGAASTTTLGSAISVDSSGNAFIVGSTNGSLDGQTLHGTEDIFFTKYDSNGLRQWTIQNGKAGATVSGNYIAIDATSHHVYVGGTSTGGIDEFSALGARSIFLSNYYGN